MKSLITIWLIILFIVLGCNCIVQGAALLPVRATPWTTSTNPTDVRISLGLYSAAESDSYLLSSTNLLWIQFITSLNAASNALAVSLGAASNSIVQAEITNAVQQTALIGLTNRAVFTETTNAGSVANITSISNRVGIVENVNGAQDAALIGLTNRIITTSNYLAVTKLDATNGTAYALTVSGLLNSTNMDAKISAASNTVHTALIATNTLLFTNISSLNTAANNNAGNVTSISNSIVQAEVINAVQQTALDGLTNSIATKQLGSAALTNLSAQVNVATNIIGAGFGLTVSSNNAGTWTITGATTNYIATTNGMSRNLTNLGSAYSDRLVVTNLVIGTNTTSDVGRPPALEVLTVNGSLNTKRTIYVGSGSGGAGGATFTYQGYGNTYVAASTDEYVPVGTIKFSSTYNSDLHAIKMGDFYSEPGKAIQFTKTNGFLYLTSGDSTYANSTNRFSIHQVNSRGVTVTNSSTENVSITNGVVNTTKALIVGTNTSSVVASNGNISLSGGISAISSAGTIHGHTLRATSVADVPAVYSTGPGFGRGGYIKLDYAEMGLIRLTDTATTNFGRLAFGLINSNFPALKRNAASLEVTDAVGNSRATNNFIVPGVVISTNGFILPASTPFTAPASLSGQGGHLWSDGTNLSVVLQDSASTRTTNNIITSLGTNYIATTNGTAYNLILSATNSANVALMVTNSNGYTNDSAQILGTNLNTGIFLKATGRVGIGTNNPNSTLEVFGISTFNGNITNFGGYASTNRLTLSRPANIGMSNQIFTDVCDQNPVYNSLYVTAGNPGNSRFHIGRSGASFYGVDFHLANLENAGSINSVYYRVGNNGQFSSVLSDNGQGVANLQSYWQWVIRPGLANNPSTSATAWNGSLGNAYGLVVEGQSTTTPALTIAPKTNTTTSPFTIERGRGAGLVTKIYEITTNGVPVSPGVLLSASTPFTAPNSLGIQGAHLWSDGTNLSVVLQDSASTRTTNNIITTDLVTILVATNSSQSNIVINFNQPAVEIFATNNLSFTNYSGIVAGMGVGRDSTAKNVRIHIIPQLINRTVIWPTLGVPANGVQWKTNANSNMGWTTLTNGSEYVLSLSSRGTNIFATITEWK